MYYQLSIERDENVINIIKVLVVDDSMLFREMISREISKDASIEVVGTAADPYMARDQILKLNPHVLILDVEMPKMSGIEFLQQLMPQHPLPVVVISSAGGNVFAAINAGAVDFVSKPNMDTNSDLDVFLRELIIKVKIASIAKVGHLKKSIYTPDLKVNNKALTKEKIIAIGASTGGTEAILQIIEALPNEMPGIVIVQHMPPVFTRMYAERLNNACRLLVKEAEDGDEITRGKVLIAAGDFQMKVVQTVNGYAVSCHKDQKVNGHCPSIDVLFDSVANTCKENAIGVILTGMGADGAKGLLHMKDNGAETIGQDEKTSVVYGMPKVAYDIGAVMKQAPLEKIPELIYAMCFDK
ncbi:MAG: chemotaxis response regulator protein-glutamate methylesterase [Hyphomonadaceae bacterium]|nr:chemotaxis response regulator protein-glutamate methylesterase [Clostridia bacterium]